MNSASTSEPPNIKLPRGPDSPQKNKGGLPTRLFGHQRHLAERKISIKPNEQALTQLHPDRLPAKYPIVRHATRFASNSGSLGAAADHDSLREDTDVR